MKVCGRRFNVYFALAAVLAMFCGCQTGKPPKDPGALRVHIETTPGASGTSQDISVLRASPLLVTISPEPILTEANLIAAKIIDSPGGFAIESIDEISASALEEYTADNPGRHLVIYGHWGKTPADGRWLAAPLITHRIGSGILSFTPDCSRAEAEQLVLGLNNVAAQIRKGQLK